MNNPKFSLIVNNRKYCDCFEDIKIFLSMENIAGTFEASTTNFYPDAVKKWNIFMGDEYKTMIDNDVVSTGYIDSIEIDDDENGSKITFAGRDKTADLADCSYFSADGISQWEGLTVQEAIEKMCKPFNIKVVVDPEISDKANRKIDNVDNKFSADDGITVVELIMRLCIKNGIIPLSYGDGFLTLTSATSVNYAYDIIKKELVKKRKVSHNNRDRFQKYIVKGQNRGCDFFADVKDYTQPAGIYVDNLISRYRPYIMILESAGSNCYDRAKFEANIRAGQSRTAEYVLQGWRQINNNQLWLPNMLVKVEDKVLGAQQPMLISEVEFDVSSSDGYTTTLHLVQKDTYSLNEAIALMKCGFDVPTAFGSLNEFSEEKRSFF